jgi:hypothetical protein
LTAVYDSATIYGFFFEVLGARFGRKSRPVFSPPLFARAIVRARGNSNLPRDSFRAYLGVALHKFDDFHLYSVCRDFFLDLFYDVFYDTFYDLFYDFFCDLFIGV